LSDFKVFSDAVSYRLKEIQKNATEFFVVDVPDLFETYLNAFPEGTNPIFRERTEHDCNTCKHFVRNLGKVVTIQAGKINTVWDLEGLPHPYDVVAKTLSEAVRSAAIVSVFRTAYDTYGHAKNTDNHDPSITWNHFHGKAPAKCVTKDPGAEKSRAESKAAVFRRGLDEIRQDDLDSVLDLIKQNAIYRGREFEKSIQDFKKLQKQYIKEGRQQTFSWEHLSAPASTFRNSVIGTLFTDLAGGDDIETAVKKFEAKVAPVNYRRPTALITPRMIEDAVTKLRDLELEEAIDRRLATFEDLSINDVLFVDNSVASRMKDSLVDSLLSSSSVKKTKKVSSNPIKVSIDNFIKAQHKSIDLILGPEHLGNFVTITAPLHNNVRNLFKWANNFAWSYDGEVTDSIKQRVAKAGGNVYNARLRVSLAWFNYDDLDIHAYCPNGRHIFYGNKSGILDVDMNAGGRNSREPVENLSWTNLRDGTYRIEVNQFSKRESIDVGFRLQVESDGVTHEFQYTSGVSGSIKALDLIISNGKLVEIKTGPKVKGSSDVVIEKWGVATNTPTKVQTILLSPNHWENAGGIGNKHWFFLFDNCRVDAPTPGFYNEFLINDLQPHRKVFEVLKSKMKCEPTNSQLSGVGFSETIPTSINAIADGRPYKITF